MVASSEGRQFDSFEEFWAFYALEHSKRSTRRLHFAGTTAALGCAALAILTPHKWAALLVPVFGYLPARMGHVMYEENIPTDHGYTAYSARAAWKMYQLMCRGQMDAEIDRIAGQIMVPEPERESEPEIRPNMMTDNTLH